MKHTMIDKSNVLVFIDDDPRPVAALDAPTSFDLDTRKLVDGKHVLKIVSRDPSGREGIRLINFEVRNGPAIVVDGIKENDRVDGIVPILVNAYSKGEQKSFIIEGSESPTGIPSWVWILIIGFIGWAMYYLIQYL